MLIQMDSVVINAITCAFIADLREMFIRVIAIKNQTIPICYLAFIGHV
jgi:hypothetical protein